MEPTPNDLKNAAQNAGNFAGDKAKQVANKADGIIDRASDKLQKGQKQAGELYEQAYDQAGELYETAKDRAVDVFDTSTDFVKKYPLYTVAGAVAIGFVAAMILRRNNRH
jgi:ElaB/YqjD/DUF883 family membrane-anchored ribosome-binding protein